MYIHSVSGCGKLNLVLFVFIHLRPYYFQITKHSKMLQKTISLNNIYLQFINLLSTKSISKYYARISRFLSNYLVKYKIFCIFYISSAFASFLNKQLIIQLPFQQRKHCRKEMQANHGNAYSGGVKMLINTFRESDSLQFILVIVADFH